MITTTLKTSSVDPLDENLEKSSLTTDAIHMTSPQINRDEVVVNVGQVQDECESESEPVSEDSEDDNVIDQRTTYKTIFANFISEREAQINKDVVDTMQEHAAGHDAVSIRELMARPESQKIINAPRDYQLDLFEKAKDQNTVAVLDTGSGKTLIAVLLLKYVLDQELEHRASGGRKRISFFLVDSVALVHQQYAVLQCNLDQPIERFSGDQGCRYWTKSVWDNVFADNMVVVCTAEILYQCLMHSFIPIQDINLIIFDEAHHAKKNHPFARIIKEHYVNASIDQQPRIFGMTASPVDSNEDPVRAAKELESILHCRIATASDLSLLRFVTSHPEEMVWVYEQLDPRCDTSLTKELNDRFCHVSALTKYFQRSRTARSELGNWSADQVWRTCLQGDAARKMERRLERLLNEEHRLVLLPEAEIRQIRMARDIIEQWPTTILSKELNSISSKVLKLLRHLNEIYKTPTDTKCIIFVTQRYTACALQNILTQLCTENLRLGLLMGTRAGEIENGGLSVRDQLLTISKFRKGDLNCLLATSVAEEGLDIPDCNYVIRFDLYATMIQYVQSRGRARHRQSKFVHMVEKHNEHHNQLLQAVTQAEEVMRGFCTRLQPDRLLNGNNDDPHNALHKERGLKKLVVSETGATLTYNSSIVVLAHFVTCLPHPPEINPTVSYYMTSEGRKFICEVVLPDKSPIKSAIGMPCQRKALARRSAAFEACCSLFKGGHLDNNLLPIYHKQLPKMRNAHLAITDKKQTSYDAKVKPDLWAASRGSIPTKLYVTVLEVEHPERVARPIQPLALLTRTPIPSLPPIILYVGPGKTTNVTSTSLRESMEVSGLEMKSVNHFTLCIYRDIFNKKFEFNIEQMSYWLAPVGYWQPRNFQLDPRSVIDWRMISSVSNADPNGLKWQPGMPFEQLTNRYLIDPRDGGRRFHSIRVEPKMKPSDPVPESAPRHKFMDSILDYSCSLFKLSRQRVQWVEDQPVVQAEKFLLRYNLFTDLSEQEKSAKTMCYLCLEPLLFSALPVSVVTMAYLFPAIITRLEAYLIALEACKLLDIDITPDLALEALTKDSDNTEEHRAKQTHVQRGMGKNYERLEFIGDAFLKMATSVSIFANSPMNDEFAYHVQRMCMICNKNLLNTALGYKIYEFIRTSAFNRRTWYFDSVKLLEGKNVGKQTSQAHKHGLADKTIADVCEALIGAAFISHRDTGNMDMAVGAVTKFVSHSDHTATRWADYFASYELPAYQTAGSTASQADLAAQIEKRIGYRFKYPRLLRSAFCHPSYPFIEEKLPSYQRLEFLGDALLDLASIEFLYHRHPDKDPQWLTEHKMAMVSNKFLAALSVKLGFHVHLRYNGVLIESQNRRYVGEVTEAEDEANGAKDYWTNVRQPPKCLSDIVESYVGALFVDSGFDFHEVELFFRNHVQPFFEDMALYDTFANNHPTTFLHNTLALSFGCSNYRLMAEGVNSYVPGEKYETIVAVLIIHNQIVADASGTSSKYAKIRASKNALEILKGLTPKDFRSRFSCDCHGATRDWVGQDGDAIGMVGTAA